MGEVLPATEGTVETPPPTLSLAIREKLSNVPPSD